MCRSLQQFEDQRDESLHRGGAFEAEGLGDEVVFELNGQEFVALNGGPRFKFTEAVSFVVNRETQEEIDYYWEKLTADGGEEVQCGWLTDKYGLSWRVVPTKIREWASDPAKFQRVMHAVMQMKKLDLATLQRAGRKSASDWWLRAEGKRPFPIRNFSVACLQTGSNLQP